MERTKMMEATELRLGLPGIEETEQESPSCAAKNGNNNINTNKRSCEQIDAVEQQQQINRSSSKASKAQIVGWPPVRSYRRNCVTEKQHQKESESEVSGIFVKVSMDGAPYLRKIDLKCYENYTDLLKALENMFKCSIGVYSEREGYNGSEYAPTYEDKDGDWMLVGDVPWDMFAVSCKRLRIMKGSEAKGLGCL